MKANPSWRSSEFAIKRIWKLRFKPTVVDPVTQSDTRRNKHTLDHHHLATVVGLG